MTDTRLLYYFGCSGKVRCPVCVCVYVYDADSVPGTHSHGRINSLVYDYFLIDFSILLFFHIILIDCLTRIISTIISLVQEIIITTTRSIIIQPQVNLFNQQSTIIIIIRTIMEQTTITVIAVYQQPYPVSSNNKIF